MKCRAQHLRPRVQCWSPLGCCPPSGSSQGCLKLPPRAVRDPVFRPRSPCFAEWRSANHCSQVTPPLLVLVNRFYWNTATPTTFILSVRALRHRGRAELPEREETVWPAKPKLFTLWRFDRKGLMQRREGVVESGAQVPARAWADLLCAPRSSRSLSPLQLKEEGVELVLGV